MLTAFTPSPRFGVRLSALHQNDLAEILAGQKNFLFKESRPNIIESMLKKSETPPEITRRILIHTTWDDDTPLDAAHSVISTLALFEKNKAGQDYIGLLVNFLLKRQGKKRNALASRDRAILHDIQEKYNLAPPKPAHSPRRHSVIA